MVQSLVLQLGPNWELLTAMRRERRTVSPMVCRWVHQMTQQMVQQMVQPMVQLMPHQKVHQMSPHSVLQTAEPTARSQRPGQILPHYQRQHRRQCVWRRVRSKLWPTVLRWEWSTVWRTVPLMVQPTAQQTAQPVVQPMVQPMAYLMAQRKV